MTIDLVNNNVEYHNSQSEPWRVTLVDTGLNTMTGGRIKRIQPFVGKDPFMLTYGDGVSDVDIPALIEFHKKSKKYVTLTAVQPSGKFGALEINQYQEVLSFKEKPKGDGAWINGGFFVCEPQAFDYIRSGDETIWERESLEKLSMDGQLNAYKHERFWQPMDTLRDKNELERLWASSNAPWKVWL